ncbi:MAG TPA: peptidase C39 family protein, partial [Gammaproteobacteria bacterium]|nr:peptidase C39 family protein [Gammaproteobacteria bacterium]
MSPTQAAVRPSSRVRVAGADDLEALFDLEHQAFATDRLSRRQLRYLLTRARALTLISECDGGAAGYAIVLFSRAVANARLYSIAVAERFRGRGIARRLLAAGEAAALDKGCVAMRLEVRADNEAAIALYRVNGYRPIETVPAYYEDREAALRFEKPLGQELAPRRTRVPYYRQTLDFTCGPAALMMAMKALASDLKTDRALEIELWREATTVFMTSGVGGCTPFG